MNTKKKKKGKEKQTPTTGEDALIKPETITPVLDTSKWPLLLKVHDY